MYVITSEERDVIKAWADDNYHRFKSNGPGRQFESFDRLPDTPLCVWDVRARIVDLEGLDCHETEPIFRDYIGYIVEGGKIHEHRDPNAKDGRVHVRFNAIVQLPEEGGLPIYGGIVIPTEERRYVVCRSGMDVHHCQLVKGPKARIVLSYGFLLPESVAAKYEPKAPEGDASKSVR